MIFIFISDFLYTIVDNSWTKLAYPLCQRNRYSVIFVDLPGFGQSSGRSLDQASWKRYGPEIIVAILSSFHLRHSVNVVAQCGMF
jgi:pimeloyl-ACP methyl ester carboxylesterase